ncbi:MAG: TonB-dependent receptor plug domain-containing protein [Muribaculaceae bacterium]|nr:TonB-dependent receptor plug domain-containing protein [Muribaculaceae bacterium]
MIRLLFDKHIRLLIPFLLLSFGALASNNTESGVISGRVLTTDGEPVDYAVVAIKGTSYSCPTDEKGLYRIMIPAGSYRLEVSAVGFERVERQVVVKAGESLRRNMALKPVTQLAEVVVEQSRISKIKHSAYNATAIDAGELLNTTKTLGDALSKAPGMKIRESGGVGSDMTVTMDGFSGKHVKVFIDGVPQEGVGSSFGLNNIPVGFADRIEVYRGVVPVGFGTDAIGGVINIVTPRRQRKWFADASYSYGSFNTHRSEVNAGQTFGNGLKYEITAFQNYSDNDYSVDTPVQNFETGTLNRKDLKHVKRFNDTYHNEAVIGKIGFVNKSWADRLLAGFTYSHMYQDVQTGVRQEIVYGSKHRHGHTVMPSLEYGKRNLLLPGLDVSFSANFSRNVNVNVDTATVKYNWLGETAPLSSPGEQSYQHSQATNDTWATALTASYRFRRIHTVTLSHVFNGFVRSNRNLLVNPPSDDEFTKATGKNIVGMAYRWLPGNRFNATAFAKYYHQYVAGPVASSVAQDSYVRTSRSDDYLGYGVAGTWFIPLGFQLKASYEKAYRLPTVEEMFGDEDLEVGDMELKPESSHNVNLGLSYNAAFGKNVIYAEGGLVVRDTHDYIQRNVFSLTGGKSAATYINYGRVQAVGFNFSVRYSFSGWLSVGGNFTQMNVRDNMPQAMGSTVANPAYRERMPNVPYMFADSDISLTWPRLGRRDNMLSLTYDNQFTRSFCYYVSVIGSNSDDYMVPDQFAHNLSLTYSIGRGRYNISFECRNMTGARLYDNFSLQKAGRAFYGKFRVHFGG